MEVKREDKPVTNIREQMVIAVGTKVFLSDEINKEYKRKEWEYFKAGKRSFHNSVYFTRYTVTQEKNIQKVLGITAYGYETGDMTAIIKLIKKGFRLAYSYVTQRKHVHLGEFYEHYVKKMGGLDKVVEIDSINECIIVLYLCNLQSKPLNDRSPIGKIIDAHFTRKMINAGLANQALYFTMTHLEDDIIDKLSTHFNVPRDKDWDVGLWLENQIMVATDKHIMGLFPGMAEFQKSRQKAFREGWGKFLGSYSAWVKVNGYEENTFFEGFTMTPIETKIFFSQMILSMKENDVTLEELTQQFIGFIYMKAFLHDYTKTKELFINRQQDDLFEELTKHEQEIAHERSILNTRIEDMHEKERQYKENEKRLMEELNKLRKENKQVNQNLNEVESNKKELLALRDYAFRKQNREEHPEVEEVDNKFERLMKAKGALLGGHPNWVKKLERELPNFTYLRPENKGLNFSFVRNLDVVFINTRYTNHSVTKKIMNEIEKSNVSVCYIDEYTNIHLTLSDMEEHLEKVRPDNL